MSELLPCPFCGGVGLRNDKLTKGVEGCIECQGCGTVAFASEWNRRAPDPALAQMRAALEAIMEHCYGKAGPRAFDIVAELARKAFAASPADGLVEEVRWLLTHCGTGPNPPHDFRERRDALLSKLGATHNIANKGTPGAECTAIETEEDRHHSMPDGPEYGNDGPRLDDDAERCEVCGSIMEDGQCPSGSSECEDIWTRGDRRYHESVDEKGG